MTEPLHVTSSSVKCFPLAGGVSCEAREVSKNRESLMDLSYHRQLLVVIIADLFHDLRRVFKSCEMVMICKTSDPIGEGVMRNNEKW